MYMDLSFIIPVDSCRIFTQKTAHSVLADEYVIFPFLIDKVSYGETLLLNRISKLLTYKGYTRVHKSLFYFKSAQNPL